MANPLNDYPGARKALYRIQWAVNGALAVLAAYFAASGTAVDALPKWYVLALAILPVAWTYLGVQADANTGKDTADADGVAQVDDEDSHEDLPEDSHEDLP